MNEPSVKTDGNENIFFVILSDSEEPHRRTAMKLAMKKNDSFKLIGKHLKQMVVQLADEVLR